MARDDVMDRGPILPTDDRATYLGVIYLGLPVLVSFSAIAGHRPYSMLMPVPFLFPPLAYWALRHFEKRTSGYRVSTFFAVLPISGLLCFTAAAALPLAFIGAGIEFVFIFWTFLTSIFSLGILVGLMRHDPERQKHALIRRYIVKDGGIIINTKAADDFGMKKGTGSALIDALIKILYWFYVVIVIIGMIFGGAAGLILIDIASAIAPPSPDLPVGVLVVGALALIGIGPFGMIFPALLRRWKQTARLETR